MGAGHYGSQQQGLPLSHMLSMQFHDSSCSKAVNTVTKMGPKIPYYAVEQPVFVPIFVTVFTIPNDHETVHSKNTVTKTGQKICSHQNGTQKYGGFRLGPLQQSSD
jgi:hypothetical protein